MTDESALSFALALVLWVFIPGPAILAIIGRSLTAGFGSSLKLIVGILLGDLFYLSLVLGGLAAVGKALGGVFLAIKMIGAVYLIFLGLQLWFKDPAAGRDLPDNEGAGHYKTFLAGFSITLGNPKAILFHLGFLPTFFNLPALTVRDALLIALIFISILGSSLVLYAYAAGRARRLFRDQRKMRLLNRGGGTLMIGAGIAVAVKR